METYVIEYYQVFNYLFLLSLSNIHHTCCIKEWNVLIKPKINIFVILAIGTMYQNEGLLHTIKLFPH